MKKIREYLKGKNPYMLASVAVVILSIGLISALLWDVPSAEDAGISVSSAESSMEGSVDTQEAEVQTEEVWETEEIKEVFAETQQTEETVFENPEETAEESIPVSEEIRGSASATEGLQETTESAEASTEPVMKEHPEENPDPIPKKEHDEDQETVPKEETEELPEEHPEEEARPEPEVHEHSWIFESFYQEPTCSNGGLVTQICAKCGETQITGGTPTGEHSYEVESEGDCCSAEVMVCTECNFREVREMDPDNHIDVEDGFCYGCGQKTE